jgi:predicted DNA-binding protein (MmcQ/YjbR family)
MGRVEPRSAAAGDDERDLAQIRDVCQRFPGCDEGELQDRPLFRVGRRRFAIFNGDASPPRPRWRGCGRSLHFVVDPDELEALRQDGRLAPSPHHGDRGWMFLRLDVDEVDWAEVAEFLEVAYRHVASRRLLDAFDL